MGDSFRWLRIILRSLHLVGVAGLSGGFLFALPVEAWQPYFWLAITSGVLLFIAETWLKPQWLWELAGFVVLLKLVLLGILMIFPSVWLFLLVIFISGIISHAPSQIRHWNIQNAEKL